MSPSSPLLLLLLVLPSVMAIHHVPHAAEDELAEALLGKYDADNSAALNEAELIVMIRNNSLTTQSFAALNQTEEHTHAAGAVHSEEDELAEALIGKYDMDQNDFLNETELISMIHGNSLVTSSFTALGAHAGHNHAVEETLADALLYKYDAGTKDEALNETELIAMIKANSLTLQSFSGLNQTDDHAGHDHGGGATVSEDEELADKLLAKYDVDRTTSLNEDELIAMIEGSTLTTVSFSALGAHAGHNHAEEEKLADALLDKYDAGTKDKALNEAELIAMIMANKLTDTSFSALPADAHAGHDHGGTHSPEEELADALLSMYDAGAKDNALNEAELIEMIEDNKLTTASFSTMKTQTSAADSTALPILAALVAAVVALRSRRAQ